MSKLVDRERLARLAQSLDARAKAAVKAEEERALAAEAALQGAIDGINNGTNGVLAQAKKYADDQDAAMKQVLDAEDERIAGLVATEKARAEGVEANFEGRISANEAFVAAQPAKDEAQDNKIKNLEDKDVELDQAIKDEAAAARAAEEALQGRATALETFKGQAEVKHQEMQDAIDALEALFEGDNSVDAKIEAVDNKVDALEERVELNENAIAVINGEGAGSIKKAEKDAKDYADTQIAALVNSAPEDLNTLKELADAIEAHQDVYEGYVNTVNGQIATAKQQAIDAAAEDASNKDAALKTELQAEIDADVKVEADRAKAAEQVNANAIAVNAGDIVNIKAKDEEQDGRIKDLEDLFDGENSVDNKIQAVQDDLDAFKEAQATKDGQQDNKINANATAAENAQKAADKAQEEVDAVELRMDAAEGDIDALQTFMNGHSHDTMEANIAANAEAIQNEVKEGGNRDVAIANALKDYTKTDAMKVMLGNIVNSLALSMEDNKMMLKLGGVDGITIHETSLDMATDADIDAIIAGLDQEN